MSREDVEWLWLKKSALTSFETKEFRNFVETVCRLSEREEEDQQLPHRHIRLSIQSAPSHTRETTELTHYVSPDELSSGA